MPTKESAKLISFYFVQEDEVDPQFEPVIKLTEHVEVKTNEEDEDVLFKMYVMFSSTRTSVHPPGANFQL